MEQEKKTKKVRPIVASDHDSPARYLWYVCPCCKIAIDYRDNYCRYCGAELLWDDEQK